MGKSLRALRLWTVVSMAGLIFQYIAGLLTNAYSPSSGFTNNTDYWAINWHWTFGYALGVIALVLLVLSALTRRGAYIVLAAVTFAGVASAGVFGMLFVNSSPNAPVYSIAMGVAFLVSFSANFLLSGMMMMGDRATPAAPAAWNPTP